MADDAGGDSKKRRGRPAKPEVKEVVEKPKAEKRGRAAKDDKGGEDGASPAKRGRGRPKGAGKRKAKAKSPKKGGAGRGRGRPKKAEKAEDKESSDAEQESGGDDE